MGEGLQGLEGERLTIREHPELDEPFADVPGAQPESGDPDFENRLTPIGVR